MAIHREFNLFKSTLGRSLAPLVLVLALAGINFGLYNRLSAAKLEISHTLPFWDIFEHQNLMWSVISGKFSLEQGWLQATSSERAVIQVPLELKAQQAYRIKTSLQLLKPSSMAGVLFSGQRQGALRTQEVRFVHGSLVTGYDDSAGVFHASMETAVSTLKSKHQLEIRVGTTSYSVWFDSQVVIEDLPLRYQGGLVALVAQGAAKFDDLLISSDLHPQTHTSIAMTPESLGWRGLSGIWQLHQNLLEQRETQEFDRSILFEKKAFTVSSLRLGFKHLKGVGAGLLFNAPKADQIQGAQLVRYSDDGNSIFWGYYTQGGVFKGQGSAKVANPATQSHLLEVQILSKRYAVWLDGKKLARDIALISRSGFVGLSASQCIARFETLKLNMASGSVQLLPIQGKP